jgi:Flp pilus assembly protein TadG
LIVLFALAVVGAALYAQDVSQVQRAASDAARMASLQGDPGSAQGAANEAAKADIGGPCGDTWTVTISSAPGVAVANGPGVAMIETTVTCSVDIMGLTENFAEVSYAPVDAYGGGRP